MIHRGDASQRGFTLGEILVALVIVVLGMSALMGSLSSSARSVIYMQDKTLAEWVGLNQVALMRLKLQQGQLPPQENTEGDIDFANRSWHWRQEVLPLAMQGLERIDVKVRPKDVKAGNDAGWTITVSGIVGNAVGSPQTSAVSVVWDSVGVPGQPSNGGTQLNGTGQLNPTGTGTVAPTPPGGSGAGNGSGSGTGNGGTGNPGGNGTNPNPNPGQP